MRTHLVPVAIAAVVAVASACSSTPAPGPKPVASNTSPSATVPPAHDVSPVAEPAGLFATGSFASLDTTASMLQLGGDPGQAALTLLARRPIRARLAVDAGALGAQLDRKAPVSIVVATQGLEPTFAVSLGLVDLEKGKSLLAATESIAPGVFLGQKGERQRGECAVAASAGTTRARLVCGPSREALVALAPYLARNVAAAPPKSEGELLVDVAKLDAAASAQISDALPKLIAIYKADLRTGDAAADAAVDEGAKLVSSEVLALLKDLDKVKVVATTSPEGGVRLDASATFRDQKSWTARFVGATQNVGFTGPTTVAPETTALAGLRIEDPAMFADGIRIGKAILEGFLQRTGISAPAERKKIAALLDFPFQKGTEIVAMAGAIPLAQKGEPKDDAAKTAAALDVLFGYRILRSNAPADATARWLKDLAAAYNLPGVQKVLKTAAGASLPRVKSIAAPKKAPKGSVAYELTFPPVVAGDDAKSKAKPKALDQRLHVVFVPGKSQSHLALGADPAALIDRVIALGEEGKPLADPPSALFTRMQLLRGDMFAAGGFVAYSLKASGKATPADALLDTAKNVEAGMDRLPHKGKSKVEVSVQTRPKELAIGVTIPRATFDDLNALNMKSR